MKVTFRDHDGKGRRFAEALSGAGHELVDAGGDVLLIDADVPLSPYQEACDAHDRVILYPHGAGVLALHDGQWPIHPHTAGHLVIGTGQADVLAVCGVPYPVEIVGWPYCDRAPFRRGAPRRVLFAPAHAMSDGWLRDGAAEANARIHDALVSLDVELIVRYLPVGSFGLEHLGITPHPAATYVEATFEVGDGVTAVDGVDVVVAEYGTFPNLALARGCPTVMYGQVAPVDHQNGQPGALMPRSWDRYAADIRFPLDADDTDDLGDLLARACAEEQTEWVERFIGPQMGPEVAVAAFEKLAA